jgi:hypothetical protein
MKNLIKILIILTPLSLWRGAGSEVSAQSWQWMHRMGGTATVGNQSNDDMVTDMVTDAAGNVYACGRLTNNADFMGIPVPPSTSPFPGYTIFLAKWDCSGNLTWLRTSHGGSDKGAKSIVYDNNGHLYVTGLVYVSDSLQFFDSLLTDYANDLFIAKFDTSGTMDWVRVASPGDSSLYGVPSGLAIDSKGYINYLFQAGLPGLLFPPNYYADTNMYYVARFDAFGNTISMFPIARRFPSLTWHDYELDSKDNHYMITYWYDRASFLCAGQTVYHLNPDSTKNEFLVIKLDSTGAFSNAFQIADTSYLRSAGTRLHIDSLDNIIVTGGGQSGLIIGNDTLNNPVNFNTGTNFIAKLSPSGSVMWLKQNYSQYVCANTGGITIKPNHNIAYAGYYRTALYIANDTLPATYQDIFIAEVDSNGNWIMANRLGCTGDKAEATCITTQGNNIIVAGDFKGQLLSPSDTLNFVGGNTDGFIAKFGTICTTGIEELSQNKNTSLLIYPNPANNFLNISFEQINVSSISILNTLGQSIFKTQITSPNIETVQLNVSKLPPGIYIIQATGKNNSATSKFVKY